MIGKRVTELLLETAMTIAARGDNDAQAERVLKKALDFSEMEERERGYLAYSVLLEMHSFYEKRGREKEAEEAWRGIVEIVRARYLEIIDPNWG